MIFMFCLSTLRADGVSASIFGKCRNFDFWAGENAEMNSMHEWHHPPDRIHNDAKFQSPDAACVNCSVGRAKWPLIGVTTSTMR